jgi:hypothetical protein
MGLDRLLSRGEVWGHEFVYGELLIGDRGGRREFVRERRLHGRGIGWIDAHLLASVLLADLALWTANPRLVAVATELDVSYEA